MLWTGTPAQEIQIAAYEQAHGISFPADYRTFLSTVNGGLPILREEPSRDGSVVARLFQLDAPSEDANLWSAQVRYAARIPPPLMPIGMSTSGNVLCIGLLGPSRGRVFSLDLALQGTAIEIAPTFREFLELSFTDLRETPPRHLRIVD